MLPHHVKTLLLTLVILTLLLTTGAEAKKKKHKKQKEKVHLQWAICDQDASVVLQKLEQGVLKPFKTQNVTYFDSAPPVYSSLGLGFRTKLHKGQPISMVKNRFETKPDSTPKDSECNYDRYGEKTSYTCKMSSPITNAKDLWSSAQQSFVKQFHEVNWGALKPYGPYLDPKWKFKIHGHKVVFDDVMAVLGNGTIVHLMEVEVSAKLKKGDKVYERITDHLLARGVVLCGPVQTSKTERLFKALGSTAGVRTGQETNEQKVLGGEVIEDEEL